MNSEDFWYWYHQGEIEIINFKSEYVLENESILTTIEGRWKQPMECLTMTINLDMGELKDV